MRKYGRFAFMIFTWIIDSSVNHHGVPIDLFPWTATVAYSRGIFPLFRKMYSLFCDIIFPLHLTRDTRIIQERYTWSAKKYGWKYVVLRVVRNTRDTVYIHLRENFFSKKQKGTVLAKQNTRPSPNDANIVRRILNTTNRDTRCSRCEWGRTLRPGTEISFTAQKRRALRGKRDTNTAQRDREREGKRSRGRALIFRKEKRSVALQPIALQPVAIVFTQTSTYCRRRFFVNIVVSIARALFVQSMRAG